MGHDQDLIRTIQRCLVRNPADRASVEELQRHDYLQTIRGNKKDNEGARPDQNSMTVQSLLSQLTSVLTPNTRRGLDRAMSKLSSSETDLSQLKKFDPNAMIDPTYNDDYMLVV